MGGMQSCGCDGDGIKNYVSFHHNHQIVFGTLTLLTPYVWGSGRLNSANLGANAGNFHISLY